MVAVTGFPASPGLRIGLLGGSFNPAHEGHLKISLAALKLLALDRVVWLVSPRNPLKLASTLANYDERVARAKAAAVHPRLFVSGFEAEHGYRYTIDTVLHLKRAFRRTRFVLLIGADNLVSMARWKNWTRLFDEVPIAVFARPGWDLAAPASQAARRFARYRVAPHEAKRLAALRPPAWTYVLTTHDESSASAIREKGLWPPRNSVTATPHQKSKTEGVVNWKPGSWYS